MFNLEKGGRAGDLYQFLVAYMPRRDLAKLLLFWGGGNTYNRNILRKAVWAYQYHYLLQ
jgi:hypothetical protein